MQCGQSGIYSTAGDRGVGVPHHAGSHAGPQWPCNGTATSGSGCNTAHIRKLMTMRSTVWRLGSLLWHVSDDTPSDRLAATSPNIKQQLRARRQDSIRHSCAADSNDDLLLSCSVRPFTYTAWQVSLMTAARVSWCCARASQFLLLSSTPALTASLVAWCGTLRWFWHTTSPPLRTGDAFALGLRASWS